MDKFGAKDDGNLNTFQSRSLTLGFAGLGPMGIRMARRLLSQHWNLVVYDADADADVVSDLIASGARVAASPKDLATKADVLMACYSSPELLQSVVSGADGIVSGDRARFFIDHSASGPRSSAAVADALAGAGITMIDAAVSGNPEKATDGKLMLMVSGSTTAIEAVRRVLEALSERIIVVGEKPGMGQQMKLINHYLSATALAASAEAVVVGVKAGLKPTTMLEVLNNGSGKNSATLDKIPNNVLPGSFDHGFATDLLYTDVQRFADEAEALQIPTWVANSVRQLWLQSKIASGADSDVTTIFELLEDWTDVKVRATAA